MPPGDQDIYEGLQALSEGAFPKHCPCCGRTFQDAEQFLRETEQLAGESGLKAVVDDDKPLLELYRNCVCGSTLMDFFSDRRDLSEKGIQRRQRFGHILDALENRGIERQQARQELLLILQGQHSALLEQLGLRIGPPCRAAKTPRLKSR